jgi:hypothetical protein
MGKMHKLLTSLTTSYPSRWGPIKKKNMKDADIINELREHFDWIKRYGIRPDPKYLYNQVEQKAHRSGNLVKTYCSGKPTLREIETRSLELFTQARYHADQFSKPENGWDKNTFSNTSFDQSRFTTPLYNGLEYFLESIEEMPSR